MTEKEPENLLNQCEGEAAECKPKPLRRHEIGESVVGIGNAGGGYLSMGVRGRIPRKILPVQIPTQDDLARIRLANAANLGVPRVYRALLSEGKEPPIYWCSGRNRRRFRSRSILSLNPDCL